MKKMNKKGFTLIEMLAVIAIIAVLVAIIVPAVGSSTLKAKASTDAANLRSVLSAATIEYAEKGDLDDLTASVPTSKVDDDYGIVKIVKNGDGSIKEIRCTADLETGNGMPVDGRKVKGTIHWLSSSNANDATVMLYDFLFDIENTADIPEDKTYDDYLNKASVTKIENAKVEPSLANADAGERFQFVRTGYFVKDTKHENTFNRIVGLKDSFPKAQK
jgi:prepilin-type N-terminal cleavage/methylation domain-containing protein